MDDGPASWIPILVLVWMRDICIATGSGYGRSTGKTPTAAH